jgi:hypothetical protein
MNDSEHQSRMTAALRAAIDSVACESKPLDRQLRAFALLKTIDWAAVQLQRLARDADIHGETR